MPSLQIRKLPDTIYEALKVKARNEQRSLSQQAIIALSKGLDIPFDYLKRKKKLIKEIEQDVDKWEKIRHIDVAALIREDRDNR